MQKNPYSIFHSFFFNSNKEKFIHLHFIYLSEWLETKRRQYSKENLIEIDKKNDGLEGFKFAEKGIFLSFFWQFALFEHSFVHCPWSFYSFFKSILEAFDIKQMVEYKKVEKFNLKLKKKSFNEKNY